MITLTELKKANIITIYYLMPTPDVRIIIDKTNKQIIKITSDTYENLTKECKDAWKTRSNMNAPFSNLAEFLYALCTRKKLTKHLVGNWKKEEVVGLIKTDYVNRDSST